jgi:phosphoglycolate phosphatase-like HAD superfamily hydrolase
VAEVVAVGGTPLGPRNGKDAGLCGVIGVLSGVSKQERLQPEPHAVIIASVAGLPALVAAKY